MIPDDPFDDIDRALSSGLSALAPDVAGDDETLAALAAALSSGAHAAPGRESRRTAVGVVGRRRRCRARRAAVAAHPRSGQLAVDHDTADEEASAQVHDVDLHRSAHGADEHAHDGLDADHDAPEPRRRPRAVERSRIVGHVSGPGGHHSPEPGPWAQSHYW